MVKAEKVKVKLDQLLADLDNYCASFIERMAKIKKPGKMEKSMLIFNEKYGLPKDKFSEIETFLASLYVDTEGVMSLLAEFYTDLRDYYRNLIEEDLSNVPSASYLNSFLDDIGTEINDLRERILSHIPDDLIRELVESLTFDDFLTHYLDEINFSGDSPPKFEYEDNIILVAYESYSKKYPTIEGVLLFAKILKTVLEDPSIDDPTRHALSEHLFGSIRRMTFHYRTWKRYEDLGDLVDEHSGLHRQLELDFLRALFAVAKTYFKEFLKDVSFDQNEAIHVMLGILYPYFIKPVLTLTSQIDVVWTSYWLNQSEDLVDDFFYYWKHKPFNLECFGISMLTSLFCLGRKYWEQPPYTVQGFKEWFNEIIDPSSERWTYYEESFLEVKHGLIEEIGQFLKDSIEKMSKDDIMKLMGCYMTRAKKSEKKI